MKKKIYECGRCVQYFSGKVAYDYHMNAHRRTDPKPPKPVAVRRPSGYTGGIGETPRTVEGEST